MHTQSIALNQTSAFQAAYQSLVNSGKLIVSALYGTQKRANITMVAAVGLCLLASQISSGASVNMLVCAQ